MPGASWSARSRLGGALAHAAIARPAAKGRLLVITADDPAVALLATADLRGSRDGARRLTEAGFDEGVAVLDGGMAAWRAAGQPSGSGREGLLHEPEDTWASPYHLTPGPEQDAAMRAYLDWEVGLLEQLRRSGDGALPDESAVRVTSLQ